MAFVSLIFVVIPLVGVVVSAVALGRRASNRRCTLAILLVLTGWALVFGAGALIQSGIVVPVFGGALALLAMLCICAGTVLAIVGLVECAQHRQRYDRGRKRAVFALILSTFPVGFIIWAAYLGMHQRQRLTAPQVASNRATPAQIRIGNLVLNAPAPPEAGKTITNDTWNFRLDLPSSWNEMNGKALAPNVRAGASRHQPEIFSMVLTENLPATSQLSPQAATELIKHGLEGRGPLEVLGEREFNVHGMAGWIIETKAKVGLTDFYYVRWVTLNNGTLYQIVTGGNPLEANQVRAESEKLFTGFHLIDPNRNTLAPSDVALGNFVSDRFGYSVDLRGTGWTRRFAKLDTYVPAADFGVTTANAASCFCVIPIWVGDADVDFSTLTSALTSQVGVPYPDDGVYGEKDWSQGGLHGRALAYEAHRNGEDHVFRLRVLRGHGVAYLLAAWMRKNSAPLTDQLDEAMDHVKFRDPAAPDPAPANDRERQSQLLVYNQLGLGLDRDGQSEAAKAWFKRAFETTHRNPTVLLNYVETCLKSSQAAEALAVLDKELPNFPGNQSLSASHAVAQLQTGDVEGALKSYAALFDTGWKNDLHFTGYIRELASRGRADAALAALDHYNPDHESAAMRRLRAEVLIAKGDLPAAIQTLTDLRDKSPDDQESALGLVDVYLIAHRPSDALAECERLIAAQHESVEVLRRKGMAEFSLKHYREAKATFEKALAKAPSNLEIQRLLEGVSGLLGEGRNSLVKTPIEPVKIPAALLQAESANPSDEYLRGYSAWYRCAVKAISYRKGNELKITEHEVIEIRDQQGVEKFSTLEFPYDPLGEEIFVNDVTVKGADGKVVAHGKVEDSYVVDDGVDKAASQAKILNVPVPGLQPGNILECTVTRRENGPIKAFTFQACALLKSLPVLRETLQVQAGHEEIRWEASPGIPAPQKEDGSLTWNIRRPPVYRWEPLQAPMDTFAPMVWVGDAKATWVGEAKDYMTQIKDRLAIDAPVRQAAADVTKGLETPAEKIAALTRYVQRGLTYKAIEFGRRARIPNTSSQTLRNKYGDCKDHALLLSQLLDSAGIPACMALVRSSGAVRATLPSLDQFDHAITYVPGEKGGTFIDATDKTGDFRTAPPMDYAGQQALVLDPKGAHLQTVPPVSANTSTVTTHRHVSFANDSDLVVEDDVVMTGTPAQGLRALLLAVEPPQRTLYLQRMIAAEAASLNLRDAKIEELDDPQAPLHFQLHYGIAGDFHRAGDRLAGQVPAIWERLYVNGDATENRFSPFKLWIPTHITSTLELTPPPGWHSTLGKGSSFKSPYGDASLKPTLNHDSLHFESQVARKAGEFPAEQYPAYVEAVRQIRAVVEQSIVFELKK